MISEAVYRLSGAAQAQRAKAALMRGEEHHSDAITWYEAQQAVVLAAHGTFVIYGAPTSGSFVETIAGLPGPTWAFWLVLGVLGWAQLAGLAATRLFRWRPPHMLRSYVILASMCALLILALSWFTAGSVVAGVTMLAIASASFAAFDAVQVRNGWRNGDR